MIVFYEDEDIIVCEKPVGVSSENCGKGSMPDLIKEYYILKGEAADIYTVHRLDVNVGGIMVYARNSKAAANLSSQISDGSFKKEYFTMVHGKPAEKAGTFHDFLFKDSRKNKVYCVKNLRKGVKEAELSYETIETIESKFGTVSKVRVFLKTGRSHQIRAQFAFRKMPIVGDGKYGSKANTDKIMLKSVAIELTIPKTGERRRFELKIPEFL